MTKKHFIRAAELVKSIKDGIQYGPSTIETSSEYSGNLDANFVRASWTAQAFIDLFSAYNDRFDRERFLQACGLVDSFVQREQLRGLGFSNV